MIILILFSSVLCIKLPPTTYIITQNESTLNYEIEINGRQFIIDLINEISVTQEIGASQTCNQYYKCQYCNSQCIYSFYEEEISKNGTLQEQIIKIKNYQNIEQIEELTTLQSQTNQLALGVRRNQNDANFTYPYNTFLSDITSICFANVGFLHKNTQFTENQIKVKYQIMGNKYGVKFQGIQISKDLNLKIESYSVQFDSLNPYTKIPSELFTSLFAYYKTLGFSQIKGFISIHKNKFNINKMEPIRFYINETFYLNYEPKQFLYYQGDYISLAFMRTNQPNIIQGTPFLSNLYMTINQNEQSIIFSQLDCEKEVSTPVNIQLYIISLVVIVVIVSLLLCKIIWKKKQTYIKVTLGKGTENQVELQNQQSTIEKEEDDETKI